MRCDILFPDPPHKSGPNTILYTDGVKCDGPVKTVDITLELYRTENFSTNLGTARLANADFIRRPFPLLTESQTMLSTGVGDRFAPKPCVSGRYFGKIIAAVTFRNGETLRETRNTPAVPLSCGAPQQPDAPGPVFNPGTTPATNLPDRILTIPELIRRVIGLPQQDAINLIILNGQQLGTIKTEADLEFFKGEVSGATNESGPNKIDLTISSGPGLLRVPIVESSAQLLTWPPVGGATFYQVFYQGGGLASQVTQPTAGFSFPRCEPAEHLTVRACNGVGCSVFSNVVTVTPPCPGGGGGRF